MSYGTAMKAIQPQHNSRGVNTNSQTHINKGTGGVVAPGPPRSKIKHKYLYANCQREQSSKNLFLNLALWNFMFHVYV